MPRAVSDSSTLIHLAKIGHLRLLDDFYDCVLIPSAVWREVVEEGHGRVGAQEAADAVQRGSIKVVVPHNELVLRLLRRDLDQGEAEAIALALEQKAEVVLLDESDARDVADVFGLRKTGVVGLLMRAKVEGRIPSLRQELDRLRDTGFWLNQDLYSEALEAVGEIRR